MSFHVSSFLRLRPAFARWAEAFLGSAGAGAPRLAGEHALDHGFGVGGRAHRMAPQPRLDIDTLDRVVARSETRGRQLAAADGVADSIAPDSVFALDGPCSQCVACHVVIVADGRHSRDV